MSHFQISKGFAGSQTGIVLDGTTTTAYSAVVLAYLGDTLSLQAIYNAAAGSLIGTVELQASNIKDPVVTDDTQWVSQDELSAQIPGPDGTDKSVGFELGSAGYLYYRIKYTRTSGSGTIDTYWAVKNQTNK